MSLNKIKTTFMKRLLPLFCIAIIALSCTRTVYLPIQRPAAVFVPPHIESIALINRSETPVNNVNTIERVVTGELLGLDKEAAQVALDGLARSIQDNQRFAVVRTNDVIDNPVALPGQWPPLIEWEKVEYLCRKYNTDALLILESFDSDFIVTNGARVVQRKDSQGAERAVNEFFAQGVASVNLGFRFYDPTTQTIIDEHMYGHSRRWETSGNLLQMALTNLIDHRQAVRDVSLQSGRMYSTRISPSWFTANRSFFTRGRGDANFEIGVRRATVNDWTGAKERWEISANSHNRKTAGRSYYNLALMHEILGDLETALNYARRAYTDYGIRQARDYANILRRRVNDAAVFE